jgi:K+-transporting ATPase ATPase C chain
MTHEVKTMLHHIRANLWLLALTLLLCSVLYPLALWTVGQTVFRNQAQGSLIDKDGKPTAGEAVGSRLIAQPFTGDEYFQPRPSAASYNAAASGASNWGANNYQLRFRVAKALGPIVKYGGKSTKKGQLVGPDVEKWFRAWRGSPDPAERLDRRSPQALGDLRSTGGRGRETRAQRDETRAQRGIVAQWAQTYPSAAQTWVKDDKANTAFVEQWQKTHPDEVARWITDNPNTPEPKPEDLAVPFFVSFSAEHPRNFPSQVEHKIPPPFPPPTSGGGHGWGEKVIEPVKEGTDIQAYFFDMWRQENPDVDLQPVPADMVMASGSGLDPHITLKNALYQLDRVADKWAAETKRDAAPVKKEIEDLLLQKAHAPLGGLAGVDLVNVLEVNLALRDHFGAQTRANK